MRVEQLTTEQRTLAVHRLTALWAFSESGLGGVLHALQVPFTGLIVGGFAIVIITLISYFSFDNYSKILQSLLIVLIVKAAVSPHTPFPAYVAVSFQAVVGYVLFSLFHINFLSILLLSILAMIESAVQKLLILTLFLGRSLWNAADELVDFVAEQLSVSSDNGSIWIVGTYLLIYFVGGIAVAFLTYNLIKKFSIQEHNSFLPNITIDAEVETITNQKLKKKKILVLFIVLLAISIVLFVFAANAQQASLTIIKAVVWTVSAVLLWYLVISPLFTKLLYSVLKKRQDRYSEQINATLLFLPVLKLLTAHAWKASAAYNGFKRITFFLTLLINWSLTYSEPVTSA